MTLETYLVYLAAVAVFFATPPDTSQLLIISNSAKHGLRRSAFTIVGDLAANSLQMTGAAFGLAAIIATSASAFTWIKWLGVAYLVWIGVQLILSKEQSNDVEANASGQSFRLFRQGFVTSMANPVAGFAAAINLGRYLSHRGWSDTPDLGMARCPSGVSTQATLLWLGQQGLWRIDGCRRHLAGKQRL